MMKECLNIYLSPHYDDAILSCGGLIYAQCRAGERVGILTLCTSLPDHVPESALARQYLAAWSKSGDGMANRRVENATVLSNWGVQNWECSTPDAIFRTGGGTSYYQSRADLFCEPHIDDAAFLLPVWEEWLQQLADKEKNILLYAPLGVGGHVDHELARRLGQRMGQTGWKVCFYEDYPYVELESDGVKVAQAKFESYKWTSRTVSIDVQAKIDALRAYHTQIGPVFGCDNDLVRRVKNFTADTACDINYWERLRAILAPSGRRFRLWRLLFDYHAHAERIWSWS
ncbi:GlcNAc-PI de-N-acetylase [uncultured archaeon]|nr:GlcNAc-PI de-N-acetylase [uncultured archaeon]